MLMSYILAGIFIVSALGAAAGGADISGALSEGASAAVELCIGIGGSVCFWCGFMELMSRCGLSRALARLLEPLLRRIFPASFADSECAEALAENFSANLLGLGNAATPAGIRAARRMGQLGGGGAASDELCRLVVMNTASVQLLPVTVAAVRAACGVENAFDILPCVWISSAAALCVGLAAAKALERVTR